MEDNKVANIAKAIARAQRANAQHASAYTEHQPSQSVPRSTRVATDDERHGVSYASRVDAEHGLHYLFCPHGHLYMLPCSKCQRSAESAKQNAQLAAKHLAGAAWFTK